MKRRSAIAQYEATIVLVVISLSLASVVYTGLRRESNVSADPIFVNSLTPIGGGLAIDRLAVNSSSSTALSSLSLDSASSTNGILAFDGSGYSTSQSLCSSGETTFFSVLASQAGTMQVSTDGQSWVAGTWGASVAVSPGWQEVMIEGGASCNLTLPGGQQVPAQWNQASTVVSSIPVEGSLSGDAFAFYVPTGGAPQSLLITSTGGLDHVAL
jgi:hypothetical protein